MIRWISEQLGTAAYDNIVKTDEFAILDVRELVDKKGNNDEKILEKINEGISYLKKGKKVVVCCDYGMSRSNSIAVGILALWEKKDFKDALKDVLEKIQEKEIKIQVLNSVKRAISKKDDKLINDKRILILGASGFIGRNLVHLLSKKYTIFTPSHKELDVLNDSIKLNMYINENHITHIVNLSIPKVYNCNEAIADTLLMLKNIIDTCEENDVHLIHISCWEIYSGYCTNYLKADEYLKGNPKGIYGDIKFLSETLLNSHNMNNMLKSTIVRSSPIYGADGTRPKLIYNFIDKAKKNQEILVHKYLNDLPRLDLIYITDFCKALELIIDNGSIGEFNVGSGNLISTTEIAEIIIKELKSKSKIKKILIDDYCSNICMKTEKINNLLGWQANVNVEEGLKHILNRLNKYMI